MPPAARPRRILQPGDELRGWLDIRNANTKTHSGFTFLKVDPLAIMDLAEATRLTDADAFSFLAEERTKF